MSKTCLCAPFSSSIHRRSQFAAEAAGVCAACALAPSIAVTPASEVITDMNDRRLCWGLVIAASPLLCGTSGLSRAGNGQGVHGGFERAAHDPDIGQLAHDHLNQLRVFRARGSRIEAEQVDGRVVSRIEVRGDRSPL